MKKLFEIPIDIFTNLKLINNLAKNDLKSKFAGSYLGILWGYVQPIITILVYWFVFEKAIGVGNQVTKAGISAPYILWLSAGLIPWFYFSEAFSAGTNCLIEYGYLVKKVVFKISILPVVKVISSLMTHVVLVIFMFILFGIYGFVPGFMVFQIVYYSFCVFMLALSMSYFTSAITVFFRDMSQIVAVFLQVLIWATPIMWNMQGMINEGRISEHIATVIKLNPMYYVVSGYRDTMIDHVGVWVRPGMTIYFWCVVVVLFLIGTTVFRKLKPHFADIM
jgi:teichoic acid transport system permease protein